MNSGDWMFLGAVWIAAAALLVLGIGAFIAERKAGR
jgi:hypothetical protein